MHARGNFIVPSRRTAYKGRRDQVGRCAGIQPAGRIAKPFIERVALMPGLRAFGPAGVEDLGGATRDVPGAFSIPALRATNESGCRASKVKYVPTMAVSIGMLRVDETSECWQGLAQDFPKSVGILPGDQVPVCGEVA